MHEIYASFEQINVSYFLLWKSLIKMLVIPFATVFTCKCRFAQNFLQINKSGVVSFICKKPFYEAYDGVWMTFGDKRRNDISGKIYEDIFVKIIYTKSED